MQNFKNDNMLRYGLLGILTFALAIITSISIACVYWIQQRHIKEAITTTISNTDELFKHELAEEAQMLNVMIDYLQQDKNLTQAWLAGDRDRVFEYASRKFHTINPGRKVTHFYFIEPDKTCFLRVHDPQRYGDKKNLFREVTQLLKIL